MHDIIIEIREKACVHVHHLEVSTQEETFVSQNTENIIMKGEEGVWPRSQQHEKKSNKMEASPFR